MPIPIFKLTLQDTVDRRKLLVQTLEASNVAFELCYGFDGRDGLSAENEALIERDTARQTLGCEMGTSEFVCAFHITLSIMGSSIANCHALLQA